jgi:diadenosine tetraphosphate (Ap4A) HIT family hydrolase
MSRDVAELPLYERLYVDDAWRVSHGWSSLPGWLVVSARRHVLGAGELTREEAASLGLLLRTCSSALVDAVGAERTYVMLFSEHPVFHLHLHVVPRMSWFGDDERAERVFRFLNPPADELVPAAERERLAHEIGARVNAALR